MSIRIKGSGQIEGLGAGVTEPGGMSWNTDESTMDLRLTQDVTLQVGEETLYRARNNSGEVIVNGTVVMANGTNGNSGRLLVTKAIASVAFDPHRVMGIATEDMANNGDGFVTSFGKVRGIQTNGANFGETWLEGDVLYASQTVAGALTKVRPSIATGGIISIAIVVSPHASNGTLFVRPLIEGHGADIVRFTPAGVGAVATDVQSKLRASNSPKDFGATGDGIADDTTAVQKIIDAWAANRSIEINLIGRYNIQGTLMVPNLETDDPETRLKFVGGGTLIKNNPGFMFDKTVGQTLQTGHIYFDCIRFEGANLNGQTFILNGDNVIRAHFIGCFGTKINIAKASGYLQTIYCTAGTTWRKWSGYLFDCNYLFDVKWDGVAEAGDAFLITRDAAADPACNSLKVSGNIEGLTGASGPAIKGGVCFATEITALYCEQNSGGDIDLSGGTGFHKGLTIQSCGFQPSTAQKANPNYYPVITGKGAQDSITLIGNASTHNLFDVTAGNQSAIVDSGNWVASGKNKFSPTSPRLFKFEGRKFTAALLPGYGVSLDSLTGSVGFESTRATVNGEQVAAELLSGPTNPASSPGDYGNRNWKAGTVVFSSSPTVAARQYGVGVVHDALILGWSCTASGAPGTWVEIAIMLPY